MCRILLCILAFFIPPLAVLLDQGCRNAFWWNVLFTLLFFIPGVIHALYVILSDHHHHCHNEVIVIREGHCHDRY